MAKLFNYSFFIIFALYNLAPAIILANNACPTRPSLFLENKKMEQTGLIKPAGMVAAQGVLSFLDGDKNKIALTTGYWDNNISIFSGTDWTEVENYNLSIKSPSGLIANVYEQNGKLWWVSYREKVVFVTDLAGQLIFRLETPDLAWPIGVTGDPEAGLIFIPSRVKKRPAMYVIDELNPNEYVNLRIKGMNSAPYDIDQKNGCVFLVESNEGKIWTLETHDVINKSKKATATENKFFTRLFLANHLTPKIWFSKLVRPQHQYIHDNKLYLMDTDDFSVIKIVIDAGTIQKLTLPIKHIFRGLTVSQDGRILITGFQDIENITEERTAIFIMEE